MLSNLKENNERHFEQQFFSSKIFGSAEIYVSQVQDKSINSMSISLSELIHFLSSTFSYSNFLYQ